MMTFSPSLYPHTHTHMHPHTPTHTHSLMDARVEILSECLLPPKPLDIFVFPIYTSCLATQMVARQPECTRHSAVQLAQCRRRLQVREDE